MKNILNAAMVCASWAVVAAAGAASIEVLLQVKGNLFQPTAMAFSADGEQVCMAGADSTEMGTQGGRVMLIDVARKTLTWQKKVALPETYVNISVVQCLIADKRVYVLANVMTHLSPPLSQTMTYLYLFDAKGQQVARRELDSPARDQVAYAMGVTGDGIQVAGYLKDEDQDFEYYSAFTQSLDKALKPQGAPVIRKNGAYSSFPRARIVGDSVYVGGMFASAKVGKQEPLGDDFAASRLRLARGYAWSSHHKFAAGAHIEAGVAEDGTVYGITHAERRT